MVLQQKLAFGTSGLRGLVEDLSDEVCADFTLRLLHVLGQSGPVRGLALGMDRRPSSPRMAAACAAAAGYAGVEVVDYGVLPTPALARQAMEDGVPAIMVTGSHIPFDRNGLKFYRPEGEITKEDEAAILAVEVAVPALGEPEYAPASDRASQAYIRGNVDWFPEGALAGLRIGLYAHSAAGRQENRAILEALGANVVEFGRSDAFVPVDTEAVSDDDRERGQQWASEYGLDAILSTDGDGDRPLLADERGEWLRGDVLGLLCARELGIAALAVPVNCNTAIEASGAFDEVLRTRIGSPYVLAGMEKLQQTHERVAGFEANGGFLLGSTLEEGGKILSALPTRDAVLPAVTLLVAAARRGVPLSRLLNELPARYTASDRLQDFPVATSRRLINQWQAEPCEVVRMLGLDSPLTSVDTTDGLRVTQDNGDIVHLRPSGNAPELRCYCESKDHPASQALVHKVLFRISELNKNDSFFYSAD